MRGNSGVVASQDLGSYRLSKTLQRVLGDFDRLCEYTRKGLASPPPLVRLFRRDYVAIDDAARAQSNGKFNAATVYWRGLQLVAHDAAPRPFVPDAAA
jgi:hypothetical protein